MRKYLYEAKSADGAAKSGYVEAATVAAARARLAEQGLAHAVVLDDDLIASLRESWEDSGHRADKDADLLTRYKPQPWRMVVLGLRKNWVMNLIFAGLIFWLVSSGYALPALALAVLAALLALYPGWISWQQNELHRQFWLGNWDASERIARRLRNHWLVRKAWPAHLEFDSRIASAMVKKGDFAGAMKLMAAWEGSDKVPEAAVRTKIGHLHFLARDWPASLAEMERSLVLSNHSDGMKIDVAQSLARMGHDDDRAKTLLDEVDTTGMGPLALAFYGWGRGVLAMNRGENEAALGHLAGAVAEMQKMGENPVLWGAIAVATGYLALAMARTGRREAAVAMLAPVKAMVAGHAEDRLRDGLRAEGLLEG
jgi:hypothetical protein